MSTTIRTAPPTPETPAEALVARSLLEQVAAMADRIGDNTVGQITAISNRAAAWLRANPPGQPVAIEPSGCPTPGACSCVEPASPAPGSGDVGEAAAIRSLQRLAKKWPQSLHLFSWSGSLKVTKRNSNDIDAAIADIDGIPNDGGDPELEPSTPGDTFWIDTEPEIVWPT